MSTDDGTIRLTWSADGTVAEILVDRPGKLNALTPAMLDQLEQACHEIDAARARVAVLRTAGERVFCVGADITLFSQLDGVQMWRSWIVDGHRALRALAELRCPSIALVDGLALGGGFELALACDLRIASETASFGLPETGLGTVPGWGGTGRLAALVGGGRAKEIILARRRIDAERALAWGVVNDVAPASELMARSREWVNDICAGAPVAVALSKQLIDATLAGAPTAVVEAMAGGLASGTQDLADGVTAFSEKRSPEFHGH